MNANASRLGITLRRARTEAGLTSPVAASLIGVDRTAYYRIESGERKPSLDTVEKLARWLGWTEGEVIRAAREPAPVVEEGP